MIVRPGRPTVYRVTATIQGSQQKKIVRTPDEAKLLQDKWHDAQRAGTFQMLPTRFTPDELRQAEAACGLARSLGLDLMDAVTFAFRNYKPGALQAPSPKQAIEQFLAARTDCSVSHQKSLRGTLNRFQLFVSKKDLGRIELQDIQKWLKGSYDGLEPKSYNIQVENLKNFFNWCVAQGWLTDSPAKNLETKWVPRRMPPIIHLPQVEALFQDLEENYPLYVTYYAIALFGAVRAGVREGESKRLNDRLTAGEKLLVPGGIKIMGKNGSERVCPWNPALRAWLEAYPPSPGIYPTTPNAMDDTIAEIRKRHNLPQNVLRHTGITVLALSSDSIVKTAFDCDTSETEIRKHYLGQMLPEEARAIIKLRPHSSRLAAA